MSTTETQSNKTQKIKKMSKEQIRLAIIKKKQCDKIALTIVEQLLEPHINPDWLLQNLRFISKNHMNDIIEERSIIKLCGYVLCSNLLTVIIQQQYHISTRTNKVYDVSKRKKFCSSLCYGAANYLIEQMLESPLWLREKDDIPVFQILPAKSNSTQCISGDEVDVVKINLSRNIADNYPDNNKQSTEYTPVKQTIKDIETNISNPKNDIITKKNVKLKKVSIITNTQRLLNNEMHSSELYTNEENKDCNSQESINHENSHDDNIQKVNVNLENLEIEVTDQSKIILHLHEHNKNAENINTSVNIICDNDNNKSLQSQLDKVDNRNDSKILQSQLNEISTDQNGAGKRLPPQLVETYSGNIVISSKENTNRIKKNKKCNQKKSDNTEVQTNICYNLVMHVERNVTEWVTENTFCLLLGEEDKKHQLMESLTRHDRHQQLCKKLNKLQLEDEKKDRVDLEKNVLKPLPHFSVLREEGKKMELKVHAFYEGQMAITSPEDSNQKSESEGDPMLPLTSSCTPNALRRRIFLDKINKILPDLLRALTSNSNAFSIAQCTYNNERYSLVKILISTFNLSAANIVFKSAEWTLVGLIIVKMLSIIDVQLQSLLRSKQASMYTSMILTSYKLDSSYLDRFVMEVTNNKCN